MIGASKNAQDRSCQLRRMLCWPGSSVGIQPGHAIEPDDPRETKAQSRGKERLPSTKAKPQSQHRLTVSALRATQVLSRRRDVLINRLPCHPDNVLHIGKILVTRPHPGSPPEVIDGQRRMPLFG